VLISSEGSSSATLHPLQSFSNREPDRIKPFDSVTKSSTSRQKNFSPQSADLSGRSAVSLKFKLANPS
jgi:hypothetical protein